MRGGGSPFARLRKAPWTSARRKANPARSRLAEAQPDDTDTMQENNRGPARGLILGLVPAALIWAGLIALFVKLLR